MPGRAYDKVLELAADQHGYVTTAQARTIGIQRDTIRKMATPNALERVSRGGVPRAHLPAVAVR